MGGGWRVISGGGGGGGWWVVGGERCGKITEGGFFFLVGIDPREIWPKLKSNPASSRAPPLGEQAGPSLALGLTIQMFFFLHFGSEFAILQYAILTILKS